MNLKIEYFTQVDGDKAIVKFNRNVTVEELNAMYVAMEIVLIRAQEGLADSETLFR